MLENNIGEIYFIPARGYINRKNPNEIYTSGNYDYVYGIFGRNLRYNLNAFRSSSVFYDRTGETTTPILSLKLSTDVAIPINYSQFFNVNELQCNLQNFNCGWATYCSLGLGTMGGGGGGGGSSTASGRGGLIAPSNISTPDSPFAPFRSTSTTETKLVKITNGICVNMVCPECNSYESC